MIPVAINSITSKFEVLMTAPWIIQAVNILTIPFQYVSPLWPVYTISAESSQSIRGNVWGDRELGHELRECMSQTQ